MAEEICKCGHERYNCHKNGVGGCFNLCCECNEFVQREEPEIKLVEPPKSEATFFKEEVETLLNGRYKNMSVYQTVGALEVVKTNLLERLGRLGN